MLRVVKLRRRKGGRNNYLESFRRKEKSEKEKGGKEKEKEADTKNATNLGQACHLLANEVVACLRAEPWLGSATLRDFHQLFIFGNTVVRCGTLSP